MKSMDELLPTGYFPRRRGLNVRASALALALVVGSAVPALASMPASESELGRTGVEHAGRVGTVATDESGDAAPKIRRFWVRDKHFYFSKWYAGKHRKMINFGCTKAPYYDPSPRCPPKQGFHHGLDVAMKCETRLFAGMRGTVVRPGAPGSLGSAYGPYAFRLRNHRLDLDFVIGHVLHVFVKPGDHVAKGTLMARASDQGAPDGCHLHFEVRPQGRSFDDAINPMRYIDLSRHRVR
jgi:murein DD-endopeptidase MepM/ murein hydrolase activator NlpD